MSEQDSHDIQATLAGNGDAYARLVKRHQAAVARRMWRFTRDRLQLEELVEDVFVEAFTSLRNFAGRAPFDHWLGVIATRVGYRFWKRRNRKAEQEQPLQDWDAPSPKETPELDATEAAERLHRLLAELPPRDRLVLTLMYMDDMSVTDIAEHAGWSVSMVKVQAHRARKKLKTLLERTQ